MSELRKAWHKQCAAMMKRADTHLHHEMCREMLSTGAADSEILIALERKFFLNRKQSINILELTRN